MLSLSFSHARAHTHAIGQYTLPCVLVTQKYFGEEEACIDTAHTGISPIKQTVQQVQEAVLISTCFLLLEVTCKYYYIRLNL